MGRPPRRPGWSPTRRSTGRDFRWSDWFGREAPMIVEIGSGVGEATAALAAPRGRRTTCWPSRSGGPASPMPSGAWPRPVRPTCGSAPWTPCGRWSTCSRRAGWPSCGRSSPTRGTRRSTTSAVWSPRRSRPWRPHVSRRAPCGGWPPTGPTTPSRWWTCSTPSRCCPAGWCRAGRNGRSPSSSARASPPGGRSPT